MRIEFSRHAKRRMQLYKIDKNDVESILYAFLSERDLGTGTYESVATEFAAKYGYPLKVVFSLEADKVIVITAYPLKKERRR
jgi:hypothetical protein